MASGRQRSECSSHPRSANVSRLKATDSSEHSATAQICVSSFRSARDGLDRPDHRATAGRQQYRTTHRETELTSQLTYRVLSRLAKIHVNEAKRCVQTIEFTRASRSLDAYRESHSKVHATYLVGGSVKASPAPANGHANGNHDEQMDVDTSPSDAAQPAQAEEEQVERKAFKLARSEDLDGTSSNTQADLAACKATFESISSLHIYSLEAASPTVSSSLTLSDGARISLSLPLPTRCSPRTRPASRPGPSPRTVRFSA